MTQKWSSKSAELKSARVRENQRRHRARAKAYTALLERQLADVQSRLRDVLAQNAALLSEIEDLRASLAKTSALAIDESEQDENGCPEKDVSTIDTAAVISSHTAQSAETPQIATSPELKEQQRQPQTAPSPSPCQSLSQCRACDKPTSSSQSDAAAALLDLASTAPIGWDSADAAALALQRAACARLPPPAPGESTIPCDAAYAIIRQQVRGQDGVTGCPPPDLAAINEILAPGFRGSDGREEGCRVESARVFEVIDSINPL